MGNRDPSGHSNRSISRSMASIDISSETCLETKYDAIMDVMIDVMIAAPTEIRKGQTALSKNF